MRARGALQPVHRVGDALGHPVAERRPDQDERQHRRAGSGDSRSSISRSISCCRGVSGTVRSASRPADRAPARPRPCRRTARHAPRRRTSPADPARSRGRRRRRSASAAGPTRTGRARWSPPGRGPSKMLTSWSITREIQTMMSSLSVHRGRHRRAPGSGRSPRRTRWATRVVRMRGLLDVRAQPGRHVGPGDEGQRQHRDDGGGDERQEQLAVEARADFARAGRGRARALTPAAAHSSRTAAASAARTSAPTSATSSARFDQVADRRDHGEAERVDRRRGRWRGRHRQAVPPVAGVVQNGSRDCVDPPERLVVQRPRGGAGRVDRPEAPAVDHELHVAD